MGFADYLPAMDRVLCLDCNVNVVSAGHYCMLKTRVWRQTGVGSWHFIGVLCLDCIERRLGRHLQRDDFAIARTKADRRLWTLGQPMLPRVWEGRRLLECGANPVPIPG
jgi:hypothetical protein